MGLRSNSVQSRVNNPNATSPSAAQARGAIDDDDGFSFLTGGTTEVPVTVQTTLNTQPANNYKSTQPQRPEPDEDDGISFLKMSLPPTSMHHPVVSFMPQPITTNPTITVDSFRAQSNPSPIPSSSSDDAHLKERSSSSSSLSGHGPSSIQHNPNRADSNQNPHLYPSTIQPIGRLSMSLIGDDGISFLQEAMVPTSVSSRSIHYIDREDHATDHQQGASPSATGGNFLDYAEESDVYHASSSFPRSQGPESVYRNLHMNRQFHQMQHNHAVSALARDALNLSPLTTTGSGAMLQPTTTTSQPAMSSRELREQQLAQQSNNPEDDGFSFLNTGPTHLNFKQHSSGKGKAPTLVMNRPPRDVAAMDLSVMMRDQGNDGISFLSQDQVSLLAAVNDDGISFLTDPTAALEVPPEVISDDHSKETSEESTVVLKEISFFQFVSPVELAEQLTFYLRDKFQNISREDLIGKASIGKWSTSATPTVGVISDFFNVISYVVPSEILSEPDLERRREVLVYAIDVMQSLADLNNFHLVFAFQCALSSSSVARLKKTTATLPDRSLRTLAACEELSSMSGNYSVYRAKYRNCQQLKLSALPYLGILQRDLIFMKEGNADSPLGRPVDEMLAEVYESLMFISSDKRVAEHASTQSNYNGNNSASNLSELETKRNRFLQDLIQQPWYIDSADELNEISHALEPKVLKERTRVLERDIGKEDGGKDKKDKKSFVKDFSEDASGLFNKLGRHPGDEDRHEKEKSAKAAASIQTAFEESTVALPFAVHGGVAAILTPEQEEKEAEYEAKRQLVRSNRLRYYKGLLMKLFSMQIRELIVKVDFRLRIMSNSASTNNSPSSTPTGSGSSTPSAFFTTGENEQVTPSSMTVLQLRAPNYLYSLKRVATRKGRKETGRAPGEKAEGNSKIGFAEQRQSSSAARRKTGGSPNDEIERAERPTTSSRAIPTPHTPALTSSLGSSQGGSPSPSGGMSMPSLPNLPSLPPVSTPAPVTVANTPLSTANNGPSPRGSATPVSPRTRTNTVGGMPYIAVPRQLSPRSSSQRNLANRVESPATNSPVDATASINIRASGGDQQPLQNTPPSLGRERLHVHMMNSSANAASQSTGVETVVKSTYSLEIDRAFNSYILTDVIDSVDNLSVDALFGLYKISILDGIGHLARLMERNLFKFRFNETALRNATKEAREKKHEELKELVKKWDIPEEYLPPSLMQALSSSASSGTSMLKDMPTTSTSSLDLRASLGNEAAERRRPLSPRAALKAKLLEDNSSIALSRKIAGDHSPRRAYLPKRDEDDGMGSLGNVFIGYLSSRQYSTYVIVVDDVNGETQVYRLNTNLIQHNCRNFFSLVSRDSAVLSGDQSQAGEHYKSPVSHVALQFIISLASHFGVMQLISQVDLSIETVLELLLEGREFGLTNWEFVHFYLAKRLQQASSEELEVLKERYPTILYEKKLHLLYSVHSDPLVRHGPAKDELVPMLKSALAMIQRIKNVIAVDSSEMALLREQNAKLVTWGESVESQQHILRQEVSLLRTQNRKLEGMNEALLGQLALVAQEMSEMRQQQAQFEERMMRLLGEMK